MLFQLSVRGKNSKEKFSGFLKSVTQSVDEVLLSNQRDKDDFFEHQKTFLVEYFIRVKDSTAKADRMTKSHKSTRRLLVTFYSNCSFRSIQIVLNFVLLILTCIYNSANYIS